MSVVNMSCNVSCQHVLQCQVYDMSFNWDMADLEGEDLATAVVLELAGHGSVLAASLVLSS